uniref:Helitron_like_N domain-containing protein n=1 Tax=Strongyloides papillosus TaxID=174720 RepID=A0A0N5C1S2_STREA
MSLLSVVSHFVYAYNRSKDRSTGLSPAQIFLNIPDKILHDEAIHNGLSGIHELIKDTKDQFTDSENRVVELKSILVISYSVNLCIGEMHQH